MQDLVGIEPCVLTPQIDSMNDNQEQPEPLQTFVDELTTLSKQKGFIIMGTFQLDKYDPVIDEGGAYLVDLAGRVEWVS